MGRGIRPEDPPIRLSAPLGDLYPASMAVAGVSMALYRRERTGVGSRVDMAMFDALVSLNENAITMSATTGREVLPSGRLGYTAPFGVFEASDGYICIAVLGEKVWQRFCAAIGRDDLAADPDLASGTRRAAAMDGILGEAIDDWLGRRTRDDAVHVSQQDRRPAGAQRVKPGAVHLSGLVEHHSELRGQVAEQLGDVQPRWMGDNLDDALVADLVAVAERAVDDVAPPVLREALDVRELVHQARGGKDPAGNDGVAAGELDAEVARFAAAHAGDEAVEDLAAVAADLFAANGGQLRRGKPFPAEVAVHVRSRAVAGLPGIDDDHGPALPSELERRSEPGG